MESNGGCGEALARCVLMVATARQPTRGPNSVVSLCQVEGGIATALWRRIPHGGGLVGVVQSSSVSFLVDRKSRCRFRRLREHVGGCRVR
jgi:hypothetical protein